MKKELELPQDKNIVISEFSEIIDERFTRYAFMSLEDRALPDARDGLKPSQRRVLLAMNDLKLSPNSGTEKSSKITGDCMGNFHPHGDMVIYPTMYRLAQSWVMRYPLIIGQGNFGNIDGDPPAAQRYTEAKLSHYGAAMFADFSPHSVPFQPNYNGKREEPTILPALIPNLIINGCEGIAVGWATKMLPHNLKEVVDVIKSYIKNPNITAEDIIKIMPGPDFPTGGKILNQQGVLDYYKTGHGSILLEGNYEIEYLKGEKSQIIVTQLPYQTSPAQFCVDVEKFVDSPINKLDGIQDLKNLSSKKTGIRIVVEVSKGCNPKLILNNLLKNTCLRKTMSVNATVLINNKVVPDTPILKLIETFVEHRKTVLTNKFNYELIQANNRIHILEGLIGITDKIDAVIAVIRSSDSPENAEQTLIVEKFVQSLEQAKAVLAITLRQLTKLESDKLLNEKDNLKERVSWLIKVLASKKELEKVIIREQDDLVKKIGDDRKTMLSLDVDQIEDEDLIPDEKLFISLTGEGYLRSIPVDQYRIQNRGGQGSQGVSKNIDAENIIEMFEMHSKDHVLFFTNKGLVYQKRAFEISQSGKISKGLHVSNMLNLSTNEHVNNMVALKNVNQEGYLVIVTRKGYIKKTAITEYDTSRKNAGIKGVKLIDNDEVAFAFLSKGDKDIFIVTSKGRCVRYSEKIIPIQGRGTRGSIALRLDQNDCVVQVMPIESNSIPDIFVVTTGGFGKKSPSVEYKSSNNRNVKGYSVMSTKSLIKTGNLAGACCLSKDETVLLMTSAGKCIRLSSDDVKNTGRTTMGVKIIKLDSMDSVVKVAKLTNKESDVI